MAAKPEWTKQAYESSVTSRCWSCTPWEAGWDQIQQLPEVKAVFAEETALGQVPQWAEEVVDRMIAQMPLCGHYSFPRPILQVCRAIGDRKCPDFVIGHYTAEPQRKRLMSYYVFCLDAWLKQAPLEVAKAELAMRDNLGRDWAAILEAVYKTLGTACEPKTLCVRRLIHRQRWWIKTLIWCDDRRDRFMLDVYSGDVRGDEANYGAYGNSPFGDPYFVERDLPEMKELAEQIRTTAPGGKELLGLLEHNHLCGPKAFRHLERLILRIGSLGSQAEPDYDAPILQCDDTYPDFGACEAWYKAFVSSLNAWLDGDGQTVGELGEVTPVKRWLVRILLHKVRLYEQHNPFGRLVGIKPAGKSGRKTIQ